jgi:hypothetical protein
VLLIPLVGVVAYLIARGGDMHRRADRQAEQQEAAFRGYVQDAAGSTSPADQIAKLADLHDRGVLSDQEFQREKARVLAA